MTGGPPDRRPSLRLGRYGLLTAALIGLLYWRFVFAVDGPTRILSASCSGGGSVDLDLSVYSHPLDFELGGSVGYKITYQTQAGTITPLYDNNFLSEDSHGSVSAPFVSWRFDGSRFSGPYPSYTYAPLPRTGAVRVFKSEAQVGFSPKPSSVDFMNIFLDTRRVTDTEFATIANCLAAHEQDIDRALVRMQREIPSSLTQFYHPLRVGGVFYGPPPYDDPSYMRDVKDLLSASAIPDAGGFRLFRGRTARGIINGHRIALSLTNDGTIEVRKDGSVVSFDAKGQGDVPGVSRSGWDFYFDADGCSGQKDNCGELIEMIGQRDDQSDWFLIFRQLGPATWGQTLVPSSFQP